MSQLASPGDESNQLTMCFHDRIDSTHERKKAYRPESYHDSTLGFMQSSNFKKLFDFNSL